MKDEAYGDPYYTSCGMHADSADFMNIRWWRDRRGWPLAAVGIGLVVSGVAHAVVWAVLGGPWEGPLAWRKPMLFGLSGGLTSLSLGWAWSKLPWRRADGWLAAATAWALLVEVGLIDLQTWRGVASHFNRATSFDSFLYDAMGLLILGVTAAAVDLSVRFFLQSTALAADMLLAVRAGLVLLVVSCLLGIWVSVHGDLRMAAGLPPETYGNAGVTKFPHGAVIHALQWLPTLAWAARRAGLSEASRRQLVATATTGSSLILVYALVQTFSGRGRFDAPAAIVAILGIGIACLAVPAAVIAWSLLKRRS